MSGAIEGLKGTKYYKKFTLIFSDTVSTGSPTYDLMTIKNIKCLEIFKMQFLLFEWLLYGVFSLAAIYKTTI